MAMMTEPIVSKTRVCIKNIPPRTTESDLKEFLLRDQKRQKRRDDDDENDRDENEPDGAAVLRLQITDCKILKNAKGKSRKVAFVGFRQPEQAAHVIERFHRTYLNMSRITVEAAKAKTNESDNRDAKEKTGDAKTQSATTRNGGSNNKNPTEQRDADATTAKDDKAVTDSKVEEFLSLMGAGKSKSKFWSNDTTGGEDVVEPKSKLSDDGSDSDSSTDSSSTESSSSSDSEESGDDGDAIENESGKKSSNNALSDMDFLRSKTKQVDDLEAPENDDDDSDSSSQTSSSSSSSSGSDSDDGSETVDMKDGREDKPSRNQTSSQRPAEGVHADDDDEADSDDDDDDDAKQLAEATGSGKTRLFVRNLAFETTEEDLEEQFSPFGPLTECHIPVDDQKRNKGFAFVTFQSAVDAMEATNRLDKVDFQGRLLHILQARPPPPGSNDHNHNGDKNLTWKQKQDLARKENDTKGGTSKTSEGWSASFVRGDAVVDNLAERLGLRKGEILGVKDKLSSGDAAVRLALGETQIIEENREYFQQHGVDMEALVSANNHGGGGKSTPAGGRTTKRSKTAILVKNLPFDTKVDELEKLFHVGQEPVRILLPPSRTIAMIEYGHSTDAKRAFRKLAYRRFKHVPIYLEWAPLAAKTTSSKEDPEATTNDGTAAAAPEEAEDPDEEATATTDGGSSTLYVKNLNFETTEDTLKGVFERHAGGTGTVLSVRIPRKVAPASKRRQQEGGNEPRSLSMGYGFVELSSHGAARKCSRLLKGKLVDGHALELAPTKQQQQQRPSRAVAVTPTGKKPPTKIMVRNVPFQATRTEILKLFGTFGQLKKVRLPKKFDGSHRGFAFVEFLTGKEAAAAMAALGRTHLYGRRLVLEWASTDDDDDNVTDLGDLRNKAKRDAAVADAAAGADRRRQQERANKKIRFD